MENGLWGGKEGGRDGGGGDGQQEWKQRDKLGGYCSSPREEW